MPFFRQSLYGVEGRLICHVWEIKVHGNNCKQARIVKVSSSTPATHADDHHSYPSNKFQLLRFKPRSLTDNIDASSFGAAKRGSIPRSV